MNAPEVERPTDGDPQPEEHVPSVESPGYEHDVERPLGDRTPRPEEGIERPPSPEVPEDPSIERERPEGPGSVDPGRGAD